MVVWILGAVVILGMAWFAGSFVYLKIRYHFRKEHVSPDPFTKLD